MNADKTAQSGLLWRDLVRVSKFLSLVLRHRPDEIGLELDPNGWAEIEELIARASRHGQRLTRTLIEQIVASNDKKRFALSDDGTRIRASQGHSVEIDLGLAPRQPPETLLHGTATRFLPPIREKGLLAGSRQHVHLTTDEAGALKSGRRHGKPVALVVRAGEMHRAGRVFYLSANGVWLTEHVPAEFIDFP
ncbi:MAG: RNA 2'-phosphotransferase [Gemmataceae bacterium]|nr:RNA 2'-phosphotransferase [Gemmataceae bacterium]